MRALALAIGVVLLLGALGLFAAVLVAMLTGCVSISGPCELRMEGEARVLVCQPGGHAVVLPPSLLQALETTKGASQRP
jgi:hypothetical protein